MKNTEHLEEDHRANHQPEKDYLAETTAASVASKLSTFLDDSPEQKAEPVAHRQEEKEEREQECWDVIGEEHPYF